MGTRPDSQAAPRGAEGGPLEHTLADLIPPLVHTLNNALGGISGLAELLALPGGEARCAEFAPTMIDQSARARDLLAALTELAKPAEDEERSVDLSELCARVERLVTPLAEAHGAAIERRTPSQPVVVHGPSRALFQELVRALCGALVPLPHGAGSPWRLRLRVAAGSDGPVVSLLVPGRVEASGLAGLDARCAVRELRGGQTVGRLRIAFAGAGDALTPQSAPRQETGTIVLLESDDTLAELVLDVLRESGHRATRAPGADELRRELAASRVRLVLLESAADGLGSGPDPRATSALIEEIGRAGARVGLLGSASPSGHANLDKPFRPGELLDFVRGCLGPARVRS